MVIALAYVVNDATLSVYISCSSNKFNNIILAQNLVAGKAQSKTTMGFVTDCPSGTEFTFSGWWAVSFKVIALY